MARYIERKKFLKQCAESFGYVGVTIKAIEQIADDCTTADIVPKSEVDLYRKQVDELEDELAQTYDKLENAKAEVAREIFDDIANMMVLQHGFNEKHIVAHIDFELLKELKKKYTEEKENENKD
jgi:DNA-binding transcriptional MerR regulator